MKINPVEGGAAELRGVIDGASLADEDAGECIMSPTRTLRIERRRRQVMDAAVTLFSRHGFHSTSMAQIAAEARMSVGHIYRYFNNKEAVITAIVDQDLQEKREVMARMMRDPSGASAAMLAGVGEGVTKMLDRQSAALFLEVMAEAARNPRIAESARLHHQFGLDCVAGLFENESVASGRFSKAQAAELLNLIFTGLRIRAIQDPEGDRTALAGAIRAFVADLVGLPAYPDAADDTNSVG